MNLDTRKETAQLAAFFHKFKGSGLACLLSLAWSKSPLTIPDLVEITDVSTDEVTISVGLLILEHYVIRVAGPFGCAAYTTIDRGDPGLSHILHSRDFELINPN